MLAEFLGYLGAKKPNNSPLHGVFGVLIALFFCKLSRKNKLPIGVPIKAINQPLIWMLLFCLFRFHNQALQTTAVPASVSISMVTNLIYAIHGRQLSAIKRLLDLIKFSRSRSVIPQTAFISLAAAS